VPIGHAGIRTSGEKAEIGAFRLQDSSGTALARASNEDGCRTAMNADQTAASVKLLGDLAWQLEKLARAAARLEERLDVLVWRARRSLAGTACRVTPSNGGAARRPGSMAGRRTPEAVVWLVKLKTELRPDGSLVVFVNNRRPFILQPHLGALFLALAEDTGAGDDEGVGFKTVGDLAIRMSKRLGTRRLSGETVNKYVCRLRRELCRKAGLDACVIQTNRRLGRRLAVKRPAAPGR
jgi:hypothetical protein